MDFILSSFAFQIAAMFDRTSSAAGEIFNQQFWLASEVFLNVSTDSYLYGA